MPSPPHTELVTFVFERMCAQVVEDDRYVSIVVCVPGLIVIRSAHAVQAFHM